MTRNFLFVILFTLLCCGDSVFSQEWEIVSEIQSNNGDTAFSYGADMIELDDGSFIVNSTFAYRSGVSDFYSNQPALALISSDGREIARNNYFRPGYYIASCDYVFEKDNGVFLLTSYSPDHDYTYFNHFQNFDNPPSDAKICLFKLNDDLSVAESYEHSFPIDTYEATNMYEWQETPNEYSGRIALISAIEDNDNIAGVYFKMVSAKTPIPKAEDTLFFFKMDFEGNFLLRKGYTFDELGCHVTGPGGPIEYTYRSKHLLRTDDGFIMYSRGTLSETHGVVDYFDDEFNHIAQKYIKHPEIDFEHTQSKIYSMCVTRSKNNTTYLSTQYQCAEENMIQHIRLYEIDDELNDTVTYLPVLRYVERKSNDRDRPASEAISNVYGEDTKDIYFVYTLNIGYWDMNDSWIVLEKLDSDFDTITTYYYDEEDVYDRASGVQSTKDGGVIMVSFAKKLENTDATFTKITKFNSYLSIEEAHAHNLHLAVAYPNPGDDVMNIRTGLRNATLQVYDMQGRIIHQQIITEEVTSIDASKWSSGTYIWKLKTENGKLKVEEGKWVK